jgi:hypothetical protein
MSEYSKIYVKSYTATADDPFRLEDNADIVLLAGNIHVYANNAMYGSSLSLPGTLAANSTVWFDAPWRPFDFMFKNAAAGNNCQVVIIGLMK